MSRAAPLHGSWCAGGRSSPATTNHLLCGCFSGRDGVQYSSWSPLTPRERSFTKFVLTSSFLCLLLCPNSLFIAYGSHSPWIMSLCICKCHSEPLLCPCSSLHWHLDFSGFLSVRQTVDTSFSSSDSLPLFKLCRIWPFFLSSSVCLFSNRSAKMK